VRSGQAVPGSAGLRPACGRYGRAFWNGVDASPTHSRPHEPKLFLVFDEDVADLPAGDVDSKFAQLLQDQGLGDPLMKILVDDVALEGDAEVAALNILRQYADQLLALRCSIARETVAGIVGLDQQILDGEILVAQKA